MRTYKILFLILISSTASAAVVRRAVPGGSLRNRPPTAEELEAAQGMESLMIEQMVQEMRKSVQHSDLLPVSNGEKIYQQMLDLEYSKQMSKSGRFGIADLVLEQLRGQR